MSDDIKETLIFELKLQRCTMYIPGGSALPEPLLLGLLGLWPVLVHQLEQLGGWRGR